MSENGGQVNGIESPSPFKVPLQVHQDEGIPPVVPKTLRHEVYRIQDQLKILVQNYKILRYRLSQDPDNPTILQQLDQVKDYIAEFNQEQFILLEKIRQFLRDLETGAFFKKETSPTPKDTIKKKRGRKKDPSKSKSHTPSLSDEEEEREYYSYLTDPNLCKGHEEEYKIAPPSSELCERSVRGLEVPPSPKIHPSLVKQNLFNSSNDARKYMLHLELMPSTELDEYISLLAVQRDKNKYREMLFIPEVSDKKYRNQSFLVKMAASPPQLRKRKREPPTEKNQRPVRALTFPPERMGTRKQNSMKQRRQDEEKLEIEKLMKEELVD